MNIVTRLMQSSEERRTRRVHRGPCWTLQEFADKKSEITPTLPQKELKAQKGL